MSTPRRRGGSRRRALVIAAAAALAVMLVVAAVVVAGRDDRGPSPTPTPTAPGGDALTFDRPADWERFRPGFHLTPAAHWINDPQRPVFAGGTWHLYYLYNADYPHGNGTAWYHATSDDLVTWRNEGVAIEKYRNGLGDILTGSAVVDETGSAGFGAGAVVALVTQQDDGVQRQSLFFSTDDGYTFQEYDGNPVMDNPGAVDWRDPKIVRDDRHDRWVMTLAEGKRIGFYVSTDLRSWRYVSDVDADGLGLLECPDLFEMVDPASGRRTWILAASADGTREGRTTGLAYWTGSWDGERFSADAADPQWLDDGADFYAAVTWDDPRRSATDRLSERYALGWINNWAYARDLPTEGWQGGALSVTRRIVLDDSDGRLRLRSRPAEALRGLEGDASSAPAQTIEPGAIAPLAVQPASASYRLRVTLDPSGGTLRLRLGEAGGDVTVGYDAAAGAVFVDRAHDTVAGRLSETYRTVRTSAVDAGGRLELDVLVDASSIEVFTGDGSSLTMAAYPTATTPVSVEAVDAPARIDAMSVTPLAVVDPQR